MDLQDQTGGVKAAAQDAKGVMADAADRVMSYASDAGGKAQDLAREAGRQATAAAETIYETGGDLLGIVEDTIRQNPLGAVLLAGVAGYGLAWLFSRR